MSAFGEFDAVAINATQDLSSLQYAVLDVNGAIVGNAGGAIGVVQNHPQSGEAAEVAYEGHMKIRVGAAVAAGARLTVTASGWAITAATSGGGIVGKALKAANSGSVVEALCDFKTAMTSNLGIV